MTREHGDVLAWLQEWFQSLPLETWAHQFGIEISTLDNPGWRVKVDLVQTPLAGLRHERVVIERDEDNWLHWRADGRTFEGACGTANLVELLETFRDLQARVGY